jgi:hypothetical protein
MVGRAKSSGDLARKSAGDMSWTSSMWWRLGPVYRLGYEAAVEPRRWPLLRRGMGTGPTVAEVCGWVEARSEGRTCWVLDVD